MTRGDICVRECLRLRGRRFRHNPKIEFGLPYCRWCGYGVAFHEALSQGAGEPCSPGGAVLEEPAGQALPPHCNAFDSTLPPPSMPSPGSEATPDGCAREGAPPDGAPPPWKITGCVTAGEREGGRE